LLIFLETSVTDKPSANDAFGNFAAAFDNAELPKESGKEFDTFASTQQV